MRTWPWVSWMAKMVRLPESPQNIGLESTCMLFVVLQNPYHVTSRPSG